MISWVEVAVSYDASRTIGPISLTVDDGEWVSIIGPNGAGKSTLLRAAISAVEFSGDVRVGGAGPRPGLDVAWMPQRPQLPEAMGVADYVMLGRTPHLGYLTAESSHDVDSVNDALTRLDLVDFARRPLGTLSGGEAQRAVLARAIAQEAPVLLLDEPTTGLDIGHAVEVLDVIDELRRSESLTVVTAAHDLTLAGRYADRLALVSAGRLAAEGRPPDVLTVETLTAHYGAGIRVISDPEGPIVVPVRKSNGRTDSPN